MKALQIFFPSPYQVVLEEKEIDEEIGDKEILVKNHYTLISPGTELAFYTGTHVGLSDPNNKWAKYPFYPGYASVGEVIKVGKDISEFKVGDLVYTLGRHCSVIKTELSDPLNRPVVKLSKDISQEEILFARLVAISLTAIHVGKFEIGEYTAVFGLGLIGNFVSQLLKIRGIGVIGIDPVENRLLKAKLCGIEYTINPDKEDIYNKIYEITGGKGLRSVIEATGIPSVLDIAFKLVDKRGQIILLGSPRGKAEIDIYNDIHRKGISIVGAHEGLQEYFDIPNRLTNTLYAIELIKRGILKVKELHTHTVVPAKAKEAYELLLNKKEEALGILIDWQEV